MNGVDELNFLLGIGPPRPNLPLTIRKSSYTSVRDLGKGTYGQAILVFNKIRNQYYVVKHINMSNMNSKQRKDAHKEISILQQLDHPNIVRYVEYFEEFPHLYIVMEYADGGDLGTHLKRIKSNTKYHLDSQPDEDPNTQHQCNGLLTEPQAISLFVQVTIALKHMHDRRLLHRDIKSQNIFLTQNHVVKLGDFGISTVLKDTVAMASTICGTPCYFSPELCLGKPYNNKSDVWALGVLLYEMCANRLPFESSTMKSLMNEILNNEPQRIPQCFSDELWELIRWMLNKDLKKRPDTQQVLMSTNVMRHMPNIIQKLKSVENAENYYEPVPGAEIAKQPSKEDKISNNDALPPIDGKTPINLGDDKVSRITPLPKKVDDSPLSNRDQQNLNRRQSTGMKEETKIMDRPDGVPNTKKEQGVHGGQAPHNVYNAGFFPQQQQNNIKNKAEGVRGKPYQPISQELPAQTPVSPMQGREFVGKEPNVIGDLSDLTPGQRAAQEVQIMERQKQQNLEKMMMRQHGAQKADKPTEFPREMHPTSLQTGSNDRLSINALIEAYDLEKKKMSNLRQKERLLNQKQSPVAPLNHHLVDNAHQQMVHGYRAPENALGAKGPARQVSTAARLPPMGGGPSNPILPAKDPNARPLPQTGCGRASSHSKDPTTAEPALRFLTPQYTPSKMVPLYRAPILPPLPSLGEGGTEEVKGDRNIETTQVRPPLSQEKENCPRSELNDVVLEMTLLLSRFTMSMRGVEDKNGGNDPEMAAALDSKREAEAKLAIGNIDDTAMATSKSGKDSCMSGRDFPSLQTTHTFVKTWNKEQLEVQTVSEEFTDTLGTRLDVGRLQAQPEQGDLSTEILEKNFQQTEERNSAQTSSDPEGKAVLSEGSTQISGSYSFGAKSEVVASAVDRAQNDSRQCESNADSKQTNFCINRSDLGANVQSKSFTSEPVADRTRNLSNGRRLTSSSLRRNSNVDYPVVKGPSKGLSRGDLNALWRDSALKYFDGSCICGGTRVRGFFSSIYGSFVCSCDACCRVSGSGYGVEWLHLPKVGDIEDVLNLMYPDTEDAMSAENGDEVNIPVNCFAGAVPGDDNGEKRLIKLSPEILLTPSEYHFTILVDVADDDYYEGIRRPEVDATNYPVSKLDEPMSGEDKGSDRGRCDMADPSTDTLQCLQRPQACRKEEEYFRVHFCPTCGCVLGMEHDGIEGLLLSKLLLVPASASVLHQFEQILDELEGKS